MIKPWPEGGRAVLRLQRDFGLPLFQGAGLIGNFGFESQGFHTLQEEAPAAGRGGYGWAQWTGPRRRQFEAYCAALGVAPDSNDANYRFVCEELRTEQAATLRALRACTSLTAAVWSAGQTYERPSGTTEQNLPGYDGRLLWAKRALASAATLVLQSALTECGLAPGPIDGVPGTLTLTAFRQIMEFSK